MVKPPPLPGHPADSPLPGSSPTRSSHNVSSPSAFPNGGHGLSLRKDSSPGALAKLDALCFEDPWPLWEHASLLKNEFVQGWMLMHEESGPVGMLCFQLVEGQAEIYKIGVVPEVRGRGWGRWLLEALIAEGLGRAWNAIFLEVRESNLAAHRLYEGCGFQASGRRHFYYRDPMENALVFKYHYPASESGKG